MLIVLNMSGEGLLEVQSSCLLHSGGQKSYCLLLTSTFFCPVFGILPRDSIKHQSISFMTWFFTQAHQASDWSRHKSNCHPVVVAHLKGRGRGLVATRKVIIHHSVWQFHFRDKLIKLLLPLRWYSDKERGASTSRATSCCGERWRGPCSK